jgi:hypothetical protein
MRALVLLPLLACAPRLEPKPYDAGEVIDAGPGDAGTFTVQQALDGGAKLIVDATSDQRWVHFDLDRSMEVDVDDAEWDVAFQRFLVKSNGGISGDGGVEVARVDAGTLDEVVTEPPGPWMIDTLDSDDEGTSPDLAFLQLPAWYAYDPRYHTLTPRPYVYVVRSTRRALFRVKVRGFYDAVGTSGVMTLDWSPMP